MKIREAALDDHDALCTLFRALDEHHVAILPERFRSFPDPARSHRQIAAIVSDPDQILLVAAEADRIAGFAHALKTSAPDLPMFVPGDFAIVDTIFVLPGERGSGLAARLLDRVRNWCRERGLRRMQLQVYTANGRAVRFYEKEGFRPLFTAFEQRLD